MKNALILLTVCITMTFCNSGQKKDLSNFVFDYEEILDDSQEDQFNKLFKDHEHKTTNEIVLVTTDDYEGHEEIKFYAVEYGEIHGTGKIDKDNGVVIAISKTNREIFIATGYGIEDILKDEIVKKFIDSLMIPKFKEDLYFEGLWEGSKAIIEFLELPGNEIKGGKEE